jgi:hypothetical protein
MVFAMAADLTSKDPFHSLLVSQSPLDISLP